MQNERLGNGLGDTLGLSLLYDAQQIINNTIFSMTNKDKKILKDLAFHVAELAGKPRETVKKNLWYQHNNLSHTRPLIFCDPENGWYEIITAQQLKCEGDLARCWEFKLRKEIFWAENMKDDRVIQPNFDVQYVFKESGRGVLEKRILPASTDGAYTRDAPLKSYTDLDRL